MMEIIHNMIDFKHNMTVFKSNNTQWRSLAIVLCALLYCGYASAQPDWAKNASKAVFSLNTFDDKGTLLSSTNGFFIADGEATTNYNPFIGASSAKAYNAKGKEMMVESISGVNETYDVAKVRIKGKDITTLNIAADSASTGAQLWLLPYNVGKKIVCEQGTILRRETFRGDYNYYTISIAASENHIGCPVMNAEGNVVGVVQEISSTDGRAYAVDVRFVRDMKNTGLSINNEALRKTNVKKALPDELDQAVLMLYMAEQSNDSVRYANIIDDFIKTFPNAADGYTSRAKLHAQGLRYDEAERDMLKAIDVAENKDDAHYNYARLIYDKATNHADAEYPAWTLEKAVEEAEKAYSINPVAVYLQMKAEIRFNEERYDDAYNVFETLTNDGHRTADIFLDAARCKQMLNDTTAMLALMDSTVNTFSKPYLKEAAPYIFTRAQAFMLAKKYRQAVADLNEYEKLLPADVNANFYHLRSQVEIEGRLYQQALNDLDRAISLSDEKVFFLSEKASLEVRVKLFDEAMATAQEIIALNPEVSDGHLFLGLAQCLKGNKTEGKRNLEKAKALGDDQAEELIERYAK